MGDSTLTSPALYTRNLEFKAEVDIEPIAGLKIKLTGNRTDNRSNQIQFMYENPTIIYGGSYIKTHIAMATAFKGFRADENYSSETFNKFLENREIIAQRLQERYEGTTYPDRGFLHDVELGGKPYSKDNGEINRSSSDVLIPAFLAAYSGKNAKTIDLNPFPGLKAILPNWLNHAYQCTYQVGSFTSFSDWVSIGEGLGFTKDVLTNGAIPSSPYNIASVVLKEQFGPLAGINATLYNDLQLTANYETQRTLTLNSAAGQLVEAVSKGFTLGGSYKIANFNQVLKIKKKQQNVNNDLTFSLNVKMSSNTNLIRKIESNTAQATSGTRTWSVDFTADYVVSKLITMGLYFDYQSNVPLVSTSAYPTTNSNYGLRINMSLAK